MFGYITTQTSICGNDKAYLSRKDTGLEIPLWHHNPKNWNKWICGRCYARDFKVPSKYRYGSRRFIGVRELTGYCSKCSNNIFDNSCKTTHMHH